MKILLIGATGLVGSHVLMLALTDPRISQVIAPTRKPLTPHAKLYAPIVDFDYLPDDESLWQVDATICTLGSTIKSAGSKAAFYQVDYTYSLTCAALVQKHGCQSFALTSAIGASAHSPFFYNRTKGELENSLRALSFDSLTLVRPNIIGGQRDHKRLGELVMLRTLSFLSPILPSFCKISPATNIAKVLLESVIEGKKGVTVISSGQLA